MKGLKDIIRIIWTELKEPTSSLILSLLSLIIALPIFISIYKFLPVMNVFSENGFRLDYLFFFGLIFIGCYWTVKKYSRIFYVLSLIGFLGLSVSSISGFYTFKNLMNDYYALIYDLNEKIVKIDFIENKDPFNKQAQIIHAVDYNSELVKSYANNWSHKNFKGYISASPNLKILHAFSIFKEVKSRWNYTYDPINEDYFAKASTSLKSLDSDDILEGDCDDYSILMAGLIKAIGGEVQLVRTTIRQKDGNEIGHIYPELNIGNEKDLEIYTNLIKTHLFPKESYKKPIYYYQDYNGVIWLNMDYNDDYPGAYYPSNVRVSVLNWDFEE